MSFRKEKKFRLTNSDLKLLRTTLISSGMTQLYPPRIVNSCYFDTKDLKMFWDSDEGLLPRKKIRFRWYENENIINKEVKVSSEEGRFKIFNKVKGLTLDDLDDLKLCDNNYGLLYPTLLISYERCYFLFKNLRFTFDTNIKYTNLRNFIKNKINDIESVMEIKTNINTSEDYLEKIVNIQPARFSKYCRGILSFHNI